VFIVKISRKRSSWVD